MPNLIPQDIREWMRRMEFKVNDLTRRMSNVIPGDIADGVSLNDFMSSGRWRRASAVGTTTAQGYPFNGASGTLEVYWDPSNAQVQQIFVNRGGGFFTRWWNGATWSAWSSAESGGLPATLTVDAPTLQNISATTLQPLPTNVTGSIALPAGTFEVLASMSCIVGDGLAYPLNAALSARYWLSGALTYQPSGTTAGIAGLKAPIGSSGGTVSRVHTVTSTGQNLGIQARAMINNGPNDVQIGIRGIILQLTPLRRI